MSNLSFEINNSTDFFKIAIQKYQLYSADRTSSELATDSAIYAWQLTDWICNEFSHKFSYIGDLKAFRVHLVSQCPSLQIVNDIADGTKHSELSRKTEVKVAELKKGVYSKQYSRQFNTSHLKVILVTGQEIYYEDVIKEVIDFWLSFFDKELGLTINI